MEEQINYKISGIKKLISKDINNYEDFLKNKDFILSVLEQIESLINQNNDKSLINHNYKIENKEENKINEFSYLNNNLNDKKTFSTEAQTNYVQNENNNISGRLNNNSPEKNNSKTFVSFRPQLNFNYDEDLSSQKGENQENNINLSDNISDIKSEISIQKKFPEISNSTINDNQNNYNKDLYNNIEKDNFSRNFNLKEDNNEKKENKYNNQSLILREENEDSLIPKSKTNENNLDFSSFNFKSNTLQVLFNNQNQNNVPTQINESINQSQNQNNVNIMNSNDNLKYNKYYKELDSNNNLTKDNEIKNENQNYSSLFCVPKNNYSHQELNNNYNNNINNNGYNYNFSNNQNIYNYQDRENNTHLNNKELSLNNPRNYNEIPTSSKNYYLSQPNFNNMEISEIKINQTSSNISFDNQNNNYQNPQQKFIQFSTNLNYNYSNYYNPKEKINSINNKGTINLKVSSNNKINNRNYNELYNFDENKFNNQYLNNSMGHNHSNSYVSNVQTSKAFSSYTSSPPRDSKLKASRVADIIMQINSNDILKDIIFKLYSEDILDELMSSKVNINLIENIEKSIEDINRLEEEEVQKLENSNRNNDYLNESSNNKMNFTNNNFYNDKYNISDKTRHPPLPNNSKKLKINQLNNELIKKYPNKSKTILGYDKFKKEKQFNFENSLKKSGNLSENRKHSGKLFNNYTSNQGGYFDPSLQNGGESKLNYLPHSKNKTNNIYKNAQSPVKDYIENKLNIFI